MQKEIEDLRVRLSVLEEKDQQLQREIEEQDRLIQSQDCELTALLGCVSLDLPGTIKRYLNINMLSLM